MSTVPTAVVATIPSNNLFASIDIGTNSFKLLIIRAYPTGKFLTLTRQTLPSRHLLISSSSTKSLSLSLQSLIHFKSLISSHEIHPQRTFTVATHAVRQAENQKEFIKAVYESTGFDVNVLSGEEEAKFVYLGVLQFLPIWEKFVLCVDIGGGSTEFVIGREGKVVYCVSLKLGHVSLSERFGVGVGEMREFVRSVVERSGLVEEVKRFGFDVAVGSCGTIRAIEKAVFKGYCEGFVDDDNNVECRRDWRLSREDLKNVVERLCCGDEVERCRTEKYFKRRSDSIVAGAVLLEEIFGLIGIDEMEVSGYGLGEGVIAERLGEVLEGHDLSANARWRSVERLALRFNGKKRIKSAHQCASIARDIYDGIRHFNDCGSDHVEHIASLDDKDLEYLEAACMLHNIGVFVSKKKGYHKQSYHIIMNGDHLYGYSDEEIKLIALLVRHHRKKLPKKGDFSLKEYSEEKFRILCAIFRLSVKLQQHEWLNLRKIDISHSHEGFKLVIEEKKGWIFRPETPQPTPDDIHENLQPELNFFKSVLRQELSIVVESSHSTKTDTTSACAIASL